MLSRRKCLAALVALFLAFAITPTTALARTIASIGTRNYSSFDEAMRSARSGQTIKLKRNATYAGAFNKRVKINLNRKQLKLVRDGRSGLSLDVTNKVSIKNGTIVGGFYVGKRGDLTLQNVKIKKGQNSKVSIHTTKAGAKLKVVGCSSPARLAFAIFGTNAQAQFAECKFTNCKIQVDKKASAKIVSGTYSNKDKVYDSLLGVNPKGKLAIEGGSFLCRESTQPCCANNGTLVVKGGTFTNDKNGREVFKNFGTMTFCGGTATSESEYASNVIVNSTGKFTMTGGKVVSRGTGSWRNGILQDGSLGTLTLTGGTIQSDHGRAVCGPKGCITIGSGVKLIVPSNNVAVSYN